MISILLTWAFIHYWSIYSRVPTPINNPINNHAVENLRTVVKIAIDISFDDDWYAN